MSFLSMGTNGGEYAVETMPTYTPAPTIYTGGRPGVTGGPSAFVPGEIVVPPSVVNPGGRAGITVPRAWYQEPIVIGLGLVALAGGTIYLVRRARRKRKNS